MSRESATRVSRAKGGEGTATGKDRRLRATKNHLGGKREASLRIRKETSRADLFSNNHFRGSKRAVGQYTTLQGACASTKGQDAVAADCHRRGHMQSSAGRWPIRGNPGNLLLLC